MPSASNNVHSSSRSTTHADDAQDSNNNNVSSIRNSPYENNNIEFDSNYYKQVEADDGNENVNEIDDESLNIMCLKYLKESME